MQSTAIPVAKWREASIDFVTDLLVCAGGIGSIMIVIHKTRIMHLICCNKIITGLHTDNLYIRDVAKLNRILAHIYTNCGTQFVAKFGKELWGLMAATLRYSIAYHPQTQGSVEQMNFVDCQMIRCTIHQLNEVRNVTVLR